MNNKIVFIIISVFLFACSQQKSADEYKVAASEFISSKDYQSAIIELKNAIQQQPDDGKSRFLLAKSYLHTGDSSGAKKEFLRSLELNFDANLVVPLLIRSDLILGDRNSLLEHLNLIVQLNFEGQVEANAIAGIGLTILGDTQNGMPLLSQVLAHEPNENFYYQLAKGWVAANNDQVDEAIVLTKGLMERDSEFLDAKLVYANLNMLAKNHDVALLEFKAYLEVFPTNYLVKLSFISALMKAEKYTEAESETDKLLNRFPASSIANETKAELTLRESKYKEAAEYAGIALTNQPSLFKANLIAGIGHYKSNNIEMAFHHLSAIEKQMAPNHFGAQLLAIVRLQLGYTQEAITTIDAIDDINEKDFNLLANASLALIRTGEVTKAKEYINKMDDIDIENAANLSRRGTFKLSLNDFSGIEDLQQAIDIDPSYDKARLALLYNYLQKNEFDKAMTVANEWINQFPDKDSGYLAQGLVWRKQNMLTQAEASFKKALVKDSESVGGLFNLALLDMKANKLEAAYNRLTQLLSINENHLASIDLLVSLANKFDDKQKVTKFLATKSSIVFKVAQAKAMENVGQRTQAVEFLKELANEANDNPAYLAVYAKMALRASDYAAAEGLFNKLILRTPNALPAYTGLLYALEAQQKYQQAYTEVKKTQQKFPLNKNLLLFEVNYLIFSKSFDRAGEVLASVRPGDVDQNLYFGVNNLYYQGKGDFEAAKPYAMQLHQLNPDLANSFMYAKLLQRLNETQLAIKVVNSALQEYGSNLPLENLLAELNVEEDPHQSLVFYQKLAEERPDNVIVLNNLAWSAIQAGEYQLGLDTAKKAANLAPEQPQVLDTLAVAHMKMKEYAAAEKLLIQAQEIDPKNQEIMLHYAQLLIYLNRMDDSRAVLAMINDGPEKRQVEQLLVD
ncbi:PEP-CTERM system TPR-repeat protein PrsT [Thalassotalea nanhaiensis]|uniref:PEP-CTERM system TPR-repeat protein PrsT n=1 Tax=Thalassotalea nanhaiensis TaxID=3065648 RepID=A0ABY9TJL6_9GAMM|nr:PEP-CTERM system TPR-repeat protein PrsT [Colwelliaceae bacterium SQ345]